ncbi:EAL domain-containing protein [Litoribrevibacter albus]|uniref:Signal transduction protein n=1 Tax=Litoribrevibacter albus TaxID=1473156 RepID=A0AA37S670_9GAMM|nr:EAL domain-containing protein [Litoribrevibacter albus]GLQ29647.1 signal transduction protein [Litoribrevibacter albus]
MSFFFPYFQPIIDIPSGRIVGYEALARTLDSQGRVCSAGPLFSDPSVPKETLLDIDRSVRKQAIEQIKNIPEGTFLTLNISPEWIQMLKHQDAVPTIDMVLSSGIDPRRIIIEITENEGELESIQRLVEEYRALGMRIAVDDFGAGYSELNRMIALEPDLIKLDMRFFKSAIEGGIANDAIQAIGFMAERIGCDVLCEGVETEQEFNFAVECGATLIQGFMFYPAKASFIAPEEAMEKTERLRQSFLALKLEEEKERANYFKDIMSNVHLLTDLWLGTKNVPSIDSLPHMPEGFIRFYICSISGEQLSPNYEYFDGQWYQEPSFIGYNWSGRPYFYQVLAISDMLSRTEVTSRPYRDRASRELFQTIGIKLDEGRVLLVDYLYDIN